jgi:hypothetical protein
MGYVMIEDVASMVIERPVGDVFRYVANVEAIPSWVAGARVERVPGGPFGDETVFRQGRVSVGVTHYRTHRGFETESTAIAFPINLVLKRTHGRLSFEAEGEHTRFTLEHRFELQPYLARLAGLVARKTHQESQAALERLRELSRPGRS